MIADEDAGGFAVVERGEDEVVVGLLRGGIELKEEVSRGREAGRGDEREVDRRTPLCS